MPRDVPTVRRLLASLFALIYVVELAACSARAPSTPAPVPPGTAPVPVYVDAEAARRAASQPNALGAVRDDRRAIRRTLERRLDRARLEAAPLRDDALQRVERETLAEIRRDARLAEIHPAHVAARSALTTILLEARDARFGTADNLSGGERSTIGDPTLLELCLPAGDPSSGSPLLSPACAIDREWARTEHLLACQERRGGANRVAADRWLALLVSTSNVPSCRVEHHSFVSLHTETRWREYERSGDFEALVTAREALWQRLLHDESLLVASIHDRVEDLPWLVRSLDRLDAELLRQREATWQRFVMASDPVYGDARARARRDIGGGIAMIAVASGLSGGMMLGVWLSAPVGLYGTLPFLGPAIAMAVFVLLGVKFLVQGLRVARAFGATPRGDRGPAHWFQPGVGRRLRDSTGLYVVDAPAKSVVPAQ